MIDELLGRWMRALERDADLAGDPHRVTRGQALARRGRVIDLEVASGVVRADVRDRETTQVRVVWPAHGDDDWMRATRGLGRRARHVVALLDRNPGPAEFDVLESAGIALVPDAGDWTATCSCGVDRCVHVVAVYQAVVSRLAADPAVLLRLRGRDVDDLVDVLLERHLERDTGDGDPVDAGFDPQVPMHVARGDLTAVALHPRRPQDPTSLVRQLGTPPGMRDPDAFAPAVRRAAQMAWRLAAGEGAGVADEELLLAELRAQRTASPASLAAALGADPEDLTEALDRLHGLGVVLRTGSGAAARYRAAR
ncbi:MAG: hypothetical protein WD041_04750 [Nitriliruptoraceae bacterium]